MKAIRMLAATMALSVSSGFALADLPSVITMGPGFKIVVNGAKVPVFGFDRCPQAALDPQSTFQIPVEQAKACTVIPSYQREVKVRMMLRSGPVVETWGVMRYGNMLGFRRPDGNFVVPAT
ncbi:hypothetical protein ACFQDN_24225 [Pseudomonas asuensis]|uniref:Uncharacterized protein n=1 Tax=Pseudomonas asuensis TaxID=1825787 RepID=A0ABQ2GXI6_9PSED|nr:hypothetical protein [Pseudomonas asuensis]GGM18482.1 hypothetical protein GCM10009425_31830 [Pseudomonas asuensis]